MGFIFQLLLCQYYSGIKFHTNPLYKKNLKLILIKILFKSDFGALMFVRLGFIGSSFYFIVLYCP